MQRAWSQANAEYRKDYRRAKYAETGANEREKAREWKRLHPAECVAATIKRVALKKQAIPIWANMDAIKDVYREARERTAKTGASHHVDHIVPLQSPIVCGLHWEGNLQILPAFDNQSKRNRWWPDMPQQGA